MTTPTRDQIKAVLEEIRNGLGCHEEESEPIATEEEDEVLSGDSSLGIICDSVNLLNLSRIDKTRLGQSRSRTRRKDDSINSPEAKVGRPERPR